MSLINWFSTWGIRLAKTTQVKMTENQLDLTALEETVYAHPLLSKTLFIADTKRDTERAYQQGMVSHACKPCTWRLRQEDHKCEDGFGLHIESLSQKTKIRKDKSLCHS